MTWQYSDPFLPPLPCPPLFCLVACSARRVGLIVNSVCVLFNSFSTRARVEPSYAGSYKCSHFHHQGTEHSLLTPWMAMCLNSYNLRIGFHALSFETVCFLQFDHVPILCCSRKVPRVTVGDLHCTVTWCGEYDSRDTS